MQETLEHRIRERAYHLWNASGCPEGQADQYWFAAEREVLSATADAGRTTTGRGLRPGPRKAKGAAGHSRRRAS